MEAFLIQYACNYNNYINYHQYYVMWCVTRSIRAAIEKDGVMQREYTSRHALTPWGMDEVD